jgi:hypothetical protein
MYRPLNRRQQEARARKLEAMRRGKDRARMERPAPGRAPDLPELRRVITVTDYDSGEPVTRTLELYKTKRVDVFRVTAGGMPWKCCGWSVALEGLRKAYPRVPSPRSDFWESE